MKASKQEFPMARKTRLRLADYHRLAAFRLSLREFLAKTEAISISELADHLLIKNHSAVELVSRLVKAGLVAREPSIEDRRTICVRITAKGEEMLGDLSQASLEELATSAQVMRSLVAGLEEPTS
jgi:DNA-binding MarR family transcriptional regulator